MTFTVVVPTIYRISRGLSCCKRGERMPEKFSLWDTATAHDSARWKECYGGRVVR